MDIQSLGEFGLIEEIRTWVNRNKVTGNWLLTGIGDDAAVFRCGKNAQQVITADVMNEGVHFDLSYMTMEDTGWKSLAVNLSDIAAMGAVPKGALVSLQIPERITFGDIRAFYRGLLQCAKKYNVAVIGGNISRSKNDFSIAVTAFGEARKGRVLLRSGARPGDIIAVTGFPGSSVAGMKVLRNKLKSGIFSRVVRSHRRPVPRVTEIQDLMRHRVTVNACIDISDGLSSDLWHVCRASRCGAVIREDFLPLHPQARKAAKTLHENPVDYALSGGEDYELMICIPPRDLRKAVNILKQNLTAIGMITTGKNIQIIRQNEKNEILQITGFRHF